MSFCSLALGSVANTSKISVWGCCCHSVLHTRSIPRSRPEYRPFAKAESLALGYWPALSARFGDLELQPEIREEWLLFSNPLFYIYFYLSSELCLSLAFGLCPCWLVFGSTHLKRPFEWSLLRQVGMISYSLHMWHLPFIFIFILWGQPFLTGWSLEQSYSVYWLWILVVIPFCALFFILVEKPGMKLGERFNRRWATNAHPAVIPSSPGSDKFEAGNTRQKRTTQLFFSLFTCDNKIAVSRMRFYGKIAQ
jgi:hypothetical protein